MTSRRADAGVAVGGLFNKTTATGGLAGRVDEPQPTDNRGAIVRQGVELTESETEFLRSLSRPSRTGEPRTLGSKFVATGALAAAIELIREGSIDMYGVAAGDLEEMKARARAALIRAAAREGER
jgi:hypothetical protein